uniref:Uncharacterized protein n=1 Tax=Escherichia coli TaxID=562 RepID=X5FDC5_ECOLX|nr:hypothetical protein [Escherichia coli]AHW84562.1 hypothetical protein [Escherichia coli]
MRLTSGTTPFSLFELQAHVISTYRKTLLWCLNIFLVNFRTRLHKLKIYQHQQ